MKITKVPLSKLKRPDRNTRLHSEKQIAEYKRSVEMFGQIRPIVCDEDYTILAGNGLYDTLLAMGRTEADCYVVAGLSQNEKKKLMLADNRVFSLGDDDMDALNELLLELDGDLDVPGFDQDLLESLVADLSDLIEEYEEEETVDRPAAAAKESHAQETEEPEEAPLKVVPRSTYGQVYQLGKHRVMCGDATKLTDVMKLMGGEKAQLLITDPPYNVDYKGAAGSIENDNMEDTRFCAFLTKAFKAADFVMNPGAAFYIWHSDSNGYQFRNACKKSGWTVKQCLIWAKNRFVMGRQDYQWQHEPCLYGWKDGASHIWEGGRKQSTVLFYDKPTKNLLHPTMKPTELFAKLICNSTRAGDNVLDLFAGSGATLIAAEQNDRRAFCMELDPRFVDVILARWESLTEKKAILISDGFKLSA